MSEGFWSLRNAPKWWFDKRAWAFCAVFAAVLLGHRFAYGPHRVPEGKVVFYSAPYCGYSTALREYLRVSNIPFEERGVDESFGNFVRFMWAAGRGSRLPIVQVGPRVVSKGFHRAEIDAALIAAGFKPMTGPVGPQGGTERR